jgi:hypothetical protein
MQWIICDSWINRTPSSVFDWWKHYSETVIDESRQRAKYTVVQTDHNLDTQYTTCEMQTRQEKKKKRTGQHNMIALKGLSTIM